MRREGYSLRLICLLLGAAKRDREHVNMGSTNETAESGESAATEKPTFRSSVGAEVIDSEPLVCSSYFPRLPTEISRNASAIRPTAMASSPGSQSATAWNGITSEGETRGGKM